MGEGGPTATDRNCTKHGKKMNGAAKCNIPPFCVMAPSKQGDKAGLIRAHMLGPGRDTVCKPSLNLRHQTADDITPFLRRVVFSMLQPHPLN